ncbi:hypothetical protein [Agrobacterium larrymoorei]|uniref:Uncharacterized protein n=1 Tax=Agrobacterium larrymoorei TaxID=160699 RepID=A0AAF0KDD8_9HYPH|nr:hypothetical protein [Agrobacterium larrymoorei]WHA40903.1 hypothetical protein CFBP5477_013995 [Agrobacterium larrymoorei]
MFTPTWLKITAGGMLGAFALTAGAFVLGKHVGGSAARSAIEIEAAKNALDRITEMEKNNASFRNLTPRHRCLSLMRASGLSDSACD